MTLSNRSHEMSTQVAARTCAAQIDRQLGALSEHHSAAQAVRDAAPVTDDGLVMFTPETLRHAATLDRAAAQCMSAAQTWQTRWARAQGAVYRHQCWCTVRQVAAQSPVGAPQLSLAQVAALMSNRCLGDVRVIAPPGQIAGCLATHQGSNAPGLDLSALTLETAPT